MALKAAIWIHGTAMEVEYPDRLIPNGVLREGIGTHFFSLSGQFNWFHIPISTPVILDNVRPSLVKVFLFYQLHAGRIRQMHIWDGPFRVNEFDNLNLQGNHLAGIDGQNSWTVKPPLTIRYGLKLAVSVQFKTLIDSSSTQDKLEFLVSTAGADFQ